MSYVFSNLFIISLLLISFYFFYKKNEKMRIIFYLMFLSSQISHNLTMNRSYDIAFAMIFFIMLINEIRNVSKTVLK